MKGIIFQVIELKQEPVDGKTELKRGCKGEGRLGNRELVHVHADIFPFFLITLLLQLHCRCERIKWK